jgi:hypothetical protein
MDFGFGRFLEMFEERFGRWVTTALLGLLGFAAFAWAIQTVIQLVVYIYKLVISTHLLTALETESIILHSFFFAAQFAVTFLVLGFLWRKFTERRMKTLRTRLGDEMKKMEERHRFIIQTHETAMMAIALQKDAIEKSMIMMRAALQTLQKEAAKSHPAPPHPAPKPPDTPETK